MDTRRACPNCQALLVGIGLMLPHDGKTPPSPSTPRSAQLSRGLSLRLTF